jgi:hypothetical protein
MPAVAMLQSISQNESPHSVSSWDSAEQGALNCS